MIATSNTPFLVATIGFDEREKRVLKSMFGISANRSPSFASYKFSRERPADMVLIDFDNPRALNGWKAYQQIHGEASKVPAIAVTRQPDLDQHKFVVRRPIIATRLLATLESVAATELGLESPDAFAATSTIARARTASGPASAPAVAPATPSAPARTGMPSMAGSTGSTGSPTPPPAPATAEQPAPQASTAASRFDAPTAKMDAPAQIAAPATQRIEAAAPPPSAAPANMPGTGAGEPVSAHATGDGTLHEPVTALVVDDSLPVRIQMKLALQGLADEVEFAETGEEAVELLARRTFTIVFLDVILPGRDGYDICKSIKQDPRHRDTPVVMLTSNSSPADRVKGKLAGCDTYLIKPVKRAVFEEVVKDYLHAAPAT